MSPTRSSATRVAIATVAIASIAGCGSSNPGETAGTTAASSTPLREAGPIASFDAQLVSPTAVRVDYRLRSPAHLALLVAGTKRVSASGAIPFDAKGNFPDPASEAETSPPGSGRARIHFERGEFNFSGSPRLRFSLRATSDGRRFTSDAVTRNRDGLFGRANVRRAILSMNERP